MPRPCPTTGQELTKTRGKALAGTWWTKGKADTWQTRFKLEARPKWRQGRTQADAGPGRWPTKTKFGEAAKAGRKPGHRLRHGGHKDGRKADTSRTKLQTQGGHMVDKVWKRGQSGLKPDTRHEVDAWWASGGWRTQGRQALGTQPAFFS